MKKVHISANDLLSQSFELAVKVHKSGFRPDMILGVWRGGAPIAIAMQEYFEYLGISMPHTVIKATSYSGIDQQSGSVRVEGLDQALCQLNTEDQILVIDDVFDSGQTMRAILEQIREKAGETAPKAVKIACPWYKPSKNVTHLEPDYFLHETEDWLVFPHELVGLTPQEIEEGKGANLAALLIQEH